MPEWDHEASRGNPTVIANRAGLRLNVSYGTLHILSVCFFFFACGHNVSFYRLHIEAYLPQMTGPPTYTDAFTRPCIFFNTIQLVPYPSRYLVEDDFGVDGRYRSICSFNR